MGILWGSWLGGEAGHHHPPQNPVRDYISHAGVLGCWVCHTDLSTSGPACPKHGGEGWGAEELIMYPNLLHSLKHLTTLQWHTSPPNVRAARRRVALANQDGGRWDGWWV
eukprot:4012436-Amphidinium_carterae.1